MLLDQKFGFIFFVEHDSFLKNSSPKNCELGKFCKLERHQIKKYTQNKKQSF